MEASPANASLLLVDDNPANLLVLKAVLGDIAQNLVEAQSGHEALQHVRQHDFAVILLDVLMPGLSGFETARLIRAESRSRHTPIIFLTANDTDRSFLEEGYALGAVDFLVKPYHPFALRAKVREFVEIFGERQKIRQEREQLRLLLQGTTDEQSQSIRQQWDQLRRSEQELADFFESAAIGLYWLGPDGTILKANKAALEMLGYSGQECIGRPVADFLVDQETGRSILRRLKSGETLQEFPARFYRKNGQIKDVLFDANVLWREGRFIHARCFVRDVTDRKRAEEALRESEQRFARFMQHLPGLAWIKDIAGRYMYVNQAAERAFGRPADELLGRSDNELFPPQTAAHFRQNDQRAMASASGVQVIEALQHGDGVLHYSIVSKFPILGSDGRVALIGGMAIDVTEQMRVEAALRDSEERFRGLMEQAPFSIQVFRPDGETIRVNRAWEELWGVPFAKLGSYNILQDPQLEAKGIRPLIERAFAGEAARLPAIEYNPNETVPGLLADSDPARWLSAVIYPLKDADGQVREVVLIHEDITARKRAESERETFAFLVENSRDFIGICDMSFAPLFINREGLRLVGLASLEEARRYRAIEFFYPEDQAYIIEEFFPQVLQKGHGEVEIRFRHFQTGQPIWFAYSVVTVRDAAGEPVALATISRDITRLKEANQSLREADRRKDEFLATLAHELRNPLAPIQNSLQLLKLPNVDEATAWQTREVMERQVHHLVRLVDDLLDVSRVMRGKVNLCMEPVELSTVIARGVEIAKSLIDVRRHQLEIEVPQESLVLHADPVRLAQVVGNLLTNAAKYTEAGGHIRIHARREADEAVIGVADDGIGIAPDVIGHVFELFVQADHTSTRAHGGLGIGLTLVRSLVEMHGGRVDAYSAGLGKGAEFVVRLPVAAQHNEPKHDTLLVPVNGLSRGAGERILVVDDNRDAAVSLASLLRLQGFDVEVAHDGPAALETATRFVPDLVFLDLGMPGMDGLEVAERMRLVPGLQEILLVALTGWGQADVRERTSRAGFAQHLVKPLEPAALGGILAQLRQRRSGGAQAN